MVLGVANVQQGCRLPSCDELIPTRTSRKPFGMPDRVDGAFGLRARGRVTPGVSFCAPERPEMGAARASGPHLGTPGSMAGRFGRQLIDAHTARRSLRE